MIARDQKTVDAGSSGEEKQTEVPQAGAGSGDACRCKEASAMTPRQLLGLMLSDLAFWKKAKKG